MRSPAPLAPTPKCRLDAYFAKRDGKAAPAGDKQAKEEEAEETAAAAGDDEEKEEEAAAEETAAAPSS